MLASLLRAQGWQDLVRAPDLARVLRQLSWTQETEAPDERSFATVQVMETDDGAVSR